MYETINNLYKDEKHGVINGVNLCTSLDNIAKRLYDFYTTTQPETDRDKDVIYFIKSLHIDIQQLVDNVVELQTSHRDLIESLRDIKYVCKDFIKDITCKDITCANYNMDCVYGSFCIEHNN
jgi:hypothetical protein